MNESHLYELGYRFYISTNGEYYIKYKNNRIKTVTQDNWVDEVRKHQIEVRSKKWLKIKL